jgi:serine protease
MNRLLAALTVITAVVLVHLGRPAAAQRTPAEYTFRVTRDQVENLVRAASGALPYVPGEVLVKFRPGSQPSSQQRALSMLRGAASSQSRWIGDALLLQTPGEQDPVAAAAILERQPEVEWAQPNYWRRLRRTPNDPSYPRQWNFNLIDLPRAWDINPGSSSSVTVAVIDTGVTAVTDTYLFRLWTGSGFEEVSLPVRVNPDIAASRILPGYDFAFWDGPVIDFVGHGTHVAGTVVQETNNSVALAGVAYQAKLLPLKACIGYWETMFLLASFDIPGFADPAAGGCSDAAIAEAIRFAADSGAQIINISLGSPGPAPLFQDALSYAVQRGSFVAMPSGNGFEDGNLTEYPAAYAESIAGAVAVGAVGRSSRRAYYSNTGSYVELAAPGGDFRDGGLAGAIFQVTLLLSDSDPFSVVRPRFDRYAEVPGEGTSLAAPHVAGVAALLYSQGITRPAAIEAALRRFTRDLGATGRDNEYGDGLIDARLALRGFGVAR